MKEQSKQFVFTRETVYPERFIIFLVSYIFDLRYNETSITRMKVKTVLLYTRSPFSKHLGCMRAPHRERIMKVNFYWLSHTFHVFMIAVKGQQGDGKLVYHRANDFYSIMQWLSFLDASIVGFGWGGSYFGEA